MELYSEKDFENSKKQLTKHIIIAAIVIVLCIAAVVVCLNLFRKLAVVIGLFVVGGVLFMFLLMNKIMPWFRYCAYLKDIKEGKRHEMDCAFISSSDDTRTSDGVKFHDFIISLGKQIDEATGEEVDNERKLFFDADKEMPKYEAGKKLHIKTFGSYILSIDEI